MSIDEMDLLASFPPSVSVGSTNLATRAAVPGRVLLVIDDDPTGSQSVAGIPVLTSWRESDFEWAFGQGAPAVFVLTNSRSVDESTAKSLNEEVVTNAIAVSQRTGIEITFLSRSDSILRGHFPAETDAIAATARTVSNIRFDAVVLVPAFPSAGRVTVGGVHYLRDGSNLVPVAQTQFANDASFGFHHSDLRDYVEEKTRGAIGRAEVLVINLSTIRAGSTSILKQLENLDNRQVIAADCVTDDDLRALCLGLQAAEERGQRFLYRTGPSFVGSWIGQETPPPLDESALHSPVESVSVGGIIIVGSHVALTNRQLACLLTGRPDILDIELNVKRLDLAATHSPADDSYLNPIIETVSSALSERDVVIRTSRLVVTADDPAESLRISRAISDAVSMLVHAIVSLVRPRFVVAKGGITSNDVATKGLDIHRGTVVGPLFQGLVSLWKPADGLATEIPYVVFPGNVGEEDALLTVVNKLSASPQRHIN